MQLQFRYIWYTLCSYSRQEISLLHSSPFLEYVQNSRAWYTNILYPWYLFDRHSGPYNCSVSTRAARREAHELLVKELHQKQAETSEKTERKWTSVSNSLKWEQRALGLWLLMCVWGSSLLPHVAVNHVELSLGVENWTDVDVCTSEWKAAGEEMLMIYMGNKQDIYLRADRCTWPRGDLVTLWNLCEYVGVKEKVLLSSGWMKKMVKQPSSWVRYLTQEICSFLPGTTTFLLLLSLQILGTSATLQRFQWYVPFCTLPKVCGINCPVSLFSLDLF